jgi:DUF2075 family protein
MKKFIDYYLFRRPDVTPTTHVVIFDEAQRAWDEQQMASKHGENTESEPMALLKIADRVPDWCVVLGLIGEGQEIHKGEEAGLGGWVKAAKTLSEQWTIHGPSHLKGRLSSCTHSFLADPLLNLSTTLRSHVASDLYVWVGGLLDQTTPQQSLRTLAHELRLSGFPIYLTRNLEEAKEYARNRYSNEVERRFGLLASRYAKNLARLGIDNEYHFERARQLNVARWFNSPQDDVLSCSALSRPASEFDCQGLELDLPILCWGDDLFWDAERWAHNTRIRRTLNDPFKVTLNAYRVLMTRGRDGLVIFVPQDPSLDSTAAHLSGAGARWLKEA